MDTTPNHLIPYPEGTDAAADIDLIGQAMAERLELIMVAHDSGTFASRPTSTPEAPGIPGRLYRVTTGTNAGVVYMDTGTGWIVVGVRPPGDITDADLASPNNAAYKTLLQSATLIPSNAAIATHLFTTPAAQPSGTAGANAPGIIYLDDGDYVVAGKTTKLRLEVEIMNSSGLSGGGPATYIVGLYPVTAVGGSGANVSYTAGTVVAGSTVAFSSALGGGLFEGDSGDFNVPADGHYMVGLSNPAVTAHAVAINAQLQMRHV